MALDEDIPEKPEDKTIPRYRQIDKVKESLKLIRLMIDSLLDY